MGVKAGVKLCCWTGHGVWSLKNIIKSKGFPMKRLTTIVAAAVLGSGAVYAAEETGAVGEGAEASDEGRLLEEIIVTAQRTQQSQQEVPVAMAVLDADTLVREQITSTQDLQGRIPSLTVGGNGQMRNTETPTIRGQGTTYGASSGVVLYYGEVPLPADFPGSGQGGPGKFFDISNMLVLKGSQGTLFGRNTTGGALVLEPHQPEDELGGSLAVDVGNYSSRKLEGIVNVPIVEDVLLMRAGIQTLKRDGFTKDVASGEDLDNKDYWTARFGLTWRPTETVENYLLTYYTHSDDNGTGLVVEGFNPNAPLAIAGADQVIAQQRERGIRKDSPSLTPFDEIKTGGAIDQLNIDVADGTELRNIISYSIYTHAYNWDADGSSLQMQDISTEHGFNAYDISQVTEELQLRGTTLDDALEYVVGGYYQKNKPEGPQGQAIAAFNGVSVSPTKEYTIKQESYAPYAQGTYSFDSVAGLRLTAGVRYTTDKVEGTSESGPGLHSAKLNSEATTYTVGLDYKIDNTMVYGKVSRGYKAGGFSATAVTPGLYTYDPEYVLNYEIGQKSDFSIGKIPARLNTSIYYTDYSDMQRGGIDSGPNGIGSAIFTAGAAEIRGFELDAIADLFEGFRLSINYAYTDAKYKDFDIRVTTFTPQLDCTGQSIPQGGTAKLNCAPFQYTPKHQASATASYNLPLSQDVGLVNASLTYAWTDDLYSSSYSLPEAEPGAWIDSYGLLNATVSWWKVFQSNFDVSIYGTNLTNEDYRVSNSNVWNLAYYRASIYGEPRMYGARLSYTFE